MTHTKSQLNVLALNSGSSSLKFGLYGVGPSGIERLLSGEAESIGDKTPMEKRCSPRAVPFPANEKQSFASEGFSATPKCRCRPQSMARKRAQPLASLAGYASNLPSRHFEPNPIREQGRSRSVPQ